MQEEVTHTYPGDTILRNDVKYTLPGTPYFAYPCVETPRFLIPVRDVAAQKFILQMISADQGLRGFAMRALLTIPGGVVLLRTVVFRHRITT